MSPIIIIVLQELVNTEDLLTVARNVYEAFSSDWNITYCITNNDIFLTEYTIVNIFQKEF